MGNIKNKKKADDWQVYELSTEEHLFIKHLDVAVQTQLKLNQELMRDYLNTIAARNGVDPNKPLEFDLDPESAIVKIRTIAE